MTIGYYLKQLKIVTHTGFNIFGIVNLIFVVGLYGLG